MNTSTFQRFTATLRRLFARKVVLAAAIVLLAVLATALLFPALSSADPNALSLSLIHI